MALEDLEIAASVALARLLFTPDELGARRPQDAPDREAQAIADEPTARAAG